MSKHKSKKNKVFNSFLCSILILILFAISHYSVQEAIQNNTINDVVANETEIADAVDFNNGQLNIIFFYVGQGDSTLIKYNDTSMLIDAGNPGTGTKIAKYLKDSGVNEINYLVATHADSDHIGGIDEVIKNIDIKEYYLPEVGVGEYQYNQTIAAANSKNVKIIHPKENDVINFAENIDIKVKSADNYKDISKNNSSIVLQMNYINNKFLFMGDAEKEVENSHKWENVDVLKVGHHGSNTSSSDEFLNVAKPKYAFIEVGKNNKYRLPNKYALERLKNVGAKIFRTDTNESSFWLESDGNNIDVKEINLNLKPEKEQQ